MILNALCAGNVDQYLTVGQTGRFIRVDSVTGGVAARLRCWLTWCREEGARVEAAQARSGRGLESAPAPPPWIPWVVYIAVLLPGIYYAATGLSGNGPQPRTAGGLGAVLLLLLAVEKFERRRYGLRPPERPAIGLLALRMLLVEVAVTLDDTNIGKFLWLWIPYVAYLSLGRRVGYALAVFFVCSFALRFSLKDLAWYTDSERVFGILLFSVGLLFVLSLARLATAHEAGRNRAERLLADLEASHRQLAAYSEQVADLATTEERNRVARDIHDTLGYHLTVVAVQLEKATALRARDPEAADQAVLDAQRSASQALHDVRRTVGMLRNSTDGFSLSAALTELVGNLANVQPMIKLRIDGDETGFPKPALMALYRAVQEGLTNVHKHALASRVVLQVALGENAACAYVVDDGRGFDPAVLDRVRHNGNGHVGLRGVRERVELIGGSLGIDSSPTQGTALLITVPRRTTALNAVTAGEPP